MGAPPATAEAITVVATPVPLDAADPARTTLGLLRYLGGLHLRSDHPRFGGFSGLVVDREGRRLVAVSDLGLWFEAALVTGADGRLAGLAETRLRPLNDAAGRPLTKKVLADAEALARLADGSLLVGFEGRHRLLRYPRVGGAGEPYPAPPGIEAAPANAGIEALTRLADGRLLLVSEDFRTADGAAVRAWLGPPPWRPLAVVTSDGFLPTALAALPDGDALLVERRFPLLAIRLRRIAGRDIRPDARLAPKEIARFDGSLTFDNVEAASARPGPGGETVLYLLSDDNQFVLQRTLLLAFALPADR